MRHDIEHHFIGSSHRIGTNASEVVDALIHIIIYDTLGRGDTLAFHRKGGQKEENIHLKKRDRRMENDKKQKKNGTIKL